MNERRKILIVGDGECGKTSILSMFSQKGFPQAYIPTIFENYISQVKVKNRTVELVIWDSAGQEDFDRLRSLCYPDTDVILLCYSINNPDSFVNITDKWLPEIRSHCPRSPIILIANKIDLRVKENPEQEQTSSKVKFVTSLQGESLAKRIDAHTYLECSALEYIGIDKIFQEAAEAVLKTKKHKHICNIL
ncbi:DgyrCDS1845 [Dimorphilus gyrociliatus]|uniref:DgyrCDS1845 n=1 Tax=Dimorphilus gyrociliatus TaxID=2664684 RepID=A0A7I8VAC5_9ANNE|nr:DgyrCDS1845 [Dimorphilus gyrociliatus]